MGLPGRSYFLDPSYAKYLRAYKVFILAVSSILGAPLNEAIEDVNDLISFETKLANVFTIFLENVLRQLFQILVPSENRRNVTDLYLKTSIGTLQKIFPQFDWVHYFSIVLGKEADLEEPIACYCMEYLYKLFNILTNTPPRYFFSMRNRKSDLVCNFFEETLSIEAINIITIYEISNLLKKLKKKHLKSTLFRKYIR